MDRDDIAVGVLVAAGALDDVAIAQARHVPGVEAVVLLRRIFHEVLALDPQLASQRHRTLAEFGPERMVRGEAFLGLVGRKVVDDQLERVEHGDPSLGGVVEHVAHAFLEHGILNQRVCLGYADSIREQAESFRGISPPAPAGQGRQAGVVPAADMPFVDELDQLALGQHDVAQIQA